MCVRNCQIPLSYYESQSNSRTYKTTPQKTIKSILKKCFPYMEGSHSVKHADSTEDPYAHILSETQIVQKTHMLSNRLIVALPDTNLVLFSECGKAFSIGIQYRSHTDPQSALCSCLSSSLLQWAYAPCIIQLAYHIISLPGVASLQPMFCLQFILSYYENISIHPMYLYIMLSYYTLSIVKG